MKYVPYCTDLLHDEKGVNNRKTCFDDTVEIG